MCAINANCAIANVYLILLKNLFNFSFFPIINGNIFLIHSLIKSSYLEIYKKIYKTKIYIYIKYEF